MIGQVVTHFSRYRKSLKVGKCVKNNKLGEDCTWEKWPAELFR